MAGILYQVNSGEVALTAATAKSVLQVKAPANQRVLIRVVRLFGKAPAGGTDTPVKVRMTRNAANFGTGTAATPAKNNPADTETIQTTAFANFTAEPTTPTDGGLWFEIQPQLGVVEIYPIGAPIVIPGGQSVQFEFTAAAAETVLVSLVCEE